MPWAAEGTPSIAARGGPRRRGVGLTPLIDVVFILLVFFMLASSFETWRALPLATTGGAGSAAAAQGLLVEVGRDQVRCAGQPVDLDGLGDCLRRHRAARPGAEDGAVVVRPGSGVDLTRLVAVLDRLAAAGAARVSLAGSP
ncbi:ExbD/TolR family protein [Roseospirillum parvum]|uniref:Biopolymer transport protein ExbD n=1 Tax=Roseospirillum parvum TaxID=83401 RepID=A0A1G8AN44_9PROT|nr:biopolymer transporter ExbD [Roseospirillum parvum]SDH22166.1 biopolymer transport protein ExbD [Roseospirillum parvum]